MFSIEVSEDDVSDEAFEDVSSSDEVDIAFFLLLLQKAKIFWFDLSTFFEHFCRCVSVVRIGANTFFCAREELF